MKVFGYFDGPLKEAIYQFKYEGLKSMGPDLAHFCWPVFNDFGDKVVVTFVPTSRARMNERGYNPPEEIAKVLAETSGIPLASRLLKRNKFKNPQVILTKKERRENVKDAFVGNGRVRLKRKKVVIVDDLSTTGATLEECAKVLKKMGARSVWGFVLARSR